MNVIEATGLQSQQIDALKGVLIVLIVVGHNPLITGAFPGFFEALYSFHVMGFLLLPFWFPVPPLSGGLFRDRVVRYLVPHYAFYALACALFTLFLADIPWTVQLGRVAAGALIGSADTVKAGSGLSLFWFLPALLTLTVLRSAAVRGTGGIVLAIALAAHLVIGGLPEAVRVWTPFGLLVALFAYPLGRLVAWAWPRYVAPRLLGWGVAAGVVWGATLTYIYYYRSPYNVGELVLPGATHAGMLLMHDVSALAAFVTLAALCATAVGDVRGLAALGKASLLIFLIHSLVFQGLVFAARRVVEVQGLVWGIGLFVLTLAIAYGLSWSLMQSATLRRWVTPRSEAEWPPTARVAQPLRRA